MITVKTKLDPLWDAFQVTQEFIDEYPKALSVDRRLYNCLANPTTFLEIYESEEGVRRIRITYTDDTMQVHVKSANVGEWIIFRGTWIDVKSDVGFKRTYDKVNDPKYIAKFVGDEP